MYNLFYNLRYVFVDTPQPTTSTGARPSLVPSSYCSRSCHIVDLSLTAASKQMEALSALTACYSFCNYFQVGEPDKIKT